MFLETEICESIARSDYMDLITSLFFFKKKKSAAQLQYECVLASKC